MARRSGALLALSLLASAAGCGARTSVFEADDVGGFGGVSASAGNAGAQQAGSSSGGFAEGGFGASSGAGGVHSAGASAGGTTSAGAGGAHSAGASAGGTTSAGASAGGASSAGASSGGSTSCMRTGPEICDGVDNDCNGQIDDGSVCPCVVQNLGSRSYQFCSTVADWLTAQAICAKFGYHLASVRDGAADRFLGRTAASIANTRWWFGLNDRAQEGRWVWQGRTQVSYLDWAAGEPNDSGGNEDCGELNRFGPEGGWNDEPCDGALPFICESGGP